MLSTQGEGPTRTFSESPEISKNPAPIKIVILRVAHGSTQNFSEQCNKRPKQPWAFSGWQRIVAALAVEKLDDTYNDGSLFVAEILGKCFQSHDDFFMWDCGVRRLGGIGESESHSFSIGGMALAF